MSAAPSSTATLVAQALYAIGAAMCLLNTYVSIGFIVLVQLNFAIAPRIFRLNRFSVHCRV